MGLPVPMPTVVNQTSFSYTSTRSIFTMQAGPVNMNVTFLSPVTPDDLLRQSMPITYLTVQVQSADGQEHDVQLYTDVSAGRCPYPPLADSEADLGAQNGSVETERRRHNGTTASRDNSLRPLGNVMQTGTHIGITSVQSGIGGGLCLLLLPHLSPVTHPRVPKPAPHSQAPDRPAPTSQPLQSQRLAITHQQQQPPSLR